MVFYPYHDTGPEGSSRCRPKDRNEVMTFKGNCVGNE